MLRRLKCPQEVLALYSRHQVSNINYSHCIPRLKSFGPFNTSWSDTEQLELWYCNREVDWFKFMGLSPTFKDLFKVIVGINELCKSKKKWEMRYLQITAWNSEQWIRASIYKMHCIMLSFPKKLYSFFTLRWQLIYNVGLITRQGLLLFFSKHILLKAFGSLVH